MSQHYFSVMHEGEETSILMGWDSPIQGFFMVIEKPSDDEQPFWSNLDHEPSHPQTLDHFLAILHHLKISLPDQMIKELQEDKHFNVGNKHVGHILEGGSYSRIDT